MSNHTPPKLVYAKLTGKSLSGCLKRYSSKYARRLGKKVLDDEIRLAEEEAQSQLREYEIQHLSMWLETIPSDHKMRDTVEAYLSSLLQ